MLMSTPSSLDVEQGRSSLRRPNAKFIVTAAGIVGIILLLSYQNRQWLTLPSVSSGSIRWRDSEVEFDSSRVAALEAVAHAEGLHPPAVFRVLII